jgi:hypothetical protein
MRVSALTVWLIVLATATQSMGSSSDAVYQYSVEVGSRRAFLWIPPDCNQVRGIILSMANLLERRWLEDPIIRQAAAEEGLGIVWLSRGRGATLTADIQPGAGDMLLKMLKDLAAESGYAEIEHAPLIPMGHSANGQLAWTVPNWDPNRTIAAIPIKTVPLPASLRFTGVPLCYLVGQTTEWPQYRDGRPGDRDYFWPVVRDSAIRLRTAHEDNLIGVVTEPGGGHFDWSERQARFAALYIRKACCHRLPSKAPVNVPVALKRIARESGWLTDTGGMAPDQCEAAPYAQYKGDPKRAYWFFDEETARAAVAFCGDRQTRDKQMLTFVQGGTLLSVAKQGFAVLRFQPEQDGLTFRLKPDFLTEVPAELIGAGTPLGHAAGPITLRVITGPAIQTGPDTFRVQFDREGMGASLWFQEEHPGDGRYRRAVQPGSMQIPAKLAAGKPQTIAFPKIADQKVGTRTVPLQAVSDSGLPVDYYVIAGPAVVDSGKLILTDVPVKSKYPVKVTIVAYQWGRTIEPLVQTAESIEQTFSIVK